MLRLPAALLGLLTAMSLAGCNEAMRGAAAGPDVAAPVAPAAYRLPPGAPCSNEINEYHSIVQADLQTGNVEQKVSDQIDSELSKAAAACSAGKGAQAHSIVAASKARHGYRA